MALKTDYKDYIPPSGGRKYKITANSDGSSSVEDITQYQQVGDTWGAEDINQVNKLVNGAVYPNLLDNSGYKIAQAGYNGAHGSTGYLCDRWRKYTVTGSMTDEGMLLTPSGASAWLMQYKLLTDTGLSEGDTVTLTVRVDGTVYSGSATLRIKSATADADSMVDTDDIRAAVYIPAGNTDRIAVFIGIKQACTLTWTKLEKGSVATPYVPKGYGAELVECYRYFWISSMPVNIFKTTAGDYFRNTVYFPIAMRTVPSVTILSSNGTVSSNAVTMDAVKFAGNGGNDTVTSFSASADL